MSGYSDPTEPPPPDRSAPKWCPLCRKALERRWIGHRHHSRRDPGYTATAYTLFVCLECGHSVQLAKLPKSGLLRTTKRAARADVHRDTKNLRATAKREGWLP